MSDFYNSKGEVIEIETVHYLLRWFCKDQHTKYIFNSKNNAFFTPGSNEPYCKLSDIDDVDIRQEHIEYDTGDSLRSLGLHPLTGYSGEKNMVYHTDYIVKIVGVGFSKEFQFTNRKKVEIILKHLKSSIKNVRDFLDHQ